MGNVNRLKLLTQSKHSITRDTRSVCFTITFHITWQTSSSSKYFAGKKTKWNASLPTYRKDVEKRYHCITRLLCWLYQDVNTLISLPSRCLFDSIWWCFLSLIQRPRYNKKVYPLHRKRIVLHERNSFDIDVIISVASRSDTDRCRYRNTTGLYYVGVLLRRCNIETFGQIKEKIISFYHNCTLTIVRFEYCWRNRLRCQSCTLLIDLSRFLILLLRLRLCV